MSQVKAYETLSESTVPGSEQVAIYTYSTVRAKDSPPDSQGTTVCTSIVVFGGKHSRQDCSVRRLLSARHDLPDGTAALTCRDCGSITRHRSRVAEGDQAWRLSDTTGKIETRDEYETRIREVACESLANIDGHTCTFEAHGPSRFIPSAR